MNSTNHLIEGIVLCTESELDVYQTETVKCINCPTNYIHGKHTHYNIDTQEFYIVESISNLLQQVRKQRDTLLNQIDLVYCNAERWHYMTIEKQQEWSTCKQALRDFPEICDPLNPIWPILPA